MYNNIEMYDMLIRLIYSHSYENINWEYIKLVVGSIKENPNLNQILYKIYTASIYTNILHLCNNHIYVGCPGNYAKGVMSFLGLPEFMDRMLINNFIYTAIYERTFCKCGYQFCEFKEHMIIPPPLFYSI
jgi:hypothetical protein